MNYDYDMIVIGAGAAGLTASATVGELGVRVALVEERPVLGGDCTWVGCVPSKALLHVAKQVQAIRTASKYGITVGEPTVDMKQVKAYVDGVIQEIYQHETPEVFSRRGVETITGRAEFIDPHTIRVGDRQYTSKRFVLAVGASPAVPPVEGINEVSFHTNETFFDNDRLPQHLLIMGAGPIGMEMAQAYRRLGSDVTIFGAEIMPRDEPEVRDVLMRVFEGEGIRMMQGYVESLRQEGDEIIVQVSSGETLRGDLLLVATGRAPNVNGLGLEKAGVAFSKNGIKVDDHLRTNVAHIFAVGDCTEGPKFTHYAGFQGYVAARNALFGIAPIANASGHTENFPWVTFTEPEVAHVGLTEAQARERYGDEAKVFILPTSEGDRSVAEDDTAGFIKLVYKGSSDLLGATIVANRAGEMLIEYQLAMSKGMSLRGVFSGAMHAYPTYSDVARKAASKLMTGELLNSTSGKIIKRVAQAVS